MSTTDSSNAPPNFIARLSPATLSDLMAAGRRKRLKSGQPILGQSDATTDAYLLLEGRVRVVFQAVSGRSVQFLTIEAGNLFGEWSAIDHAPRTTDVIADIACEVLVVPSHTLQGLIARKSDFAQALILHLVGQLRFLSHRAAAFRSLTACSRIDAELLRLAGPDPADTVLPKVTHAELALRASTTREAVTRRLKEQAESGIIAKRGRTMILLDRSALVRLVEHPQS